MQHKPISFRNINRSPDRFYQYVYWTQKFDRSKLLDLDRYDHNTKIIIIDSCGWHYRNHFPDHDILCVEGIQMIKNISLAKEKFDKIFDDQQKTKPRFPMMQHPGSLVLFDHSVLLRYQTPETIKIILEDLSRQTSCDHFWLRMPTLLLNDQRLIDRAAGMASMVPTGFVTQWMLVDLDTPQKIFEARYSRKKVYQNDLY